MRESSHVLAELLIIRYFQNLPFPVWHLYFTSSSKIFGFVILLLLRLTKLEDFSFYIQNFLRKERKYCSFNLRFLWERLYKSPKLVIYCQRAGSIMFKVECYFDKNDFAQVINPIPWVIAAVLRAWANGPSSLHGFCLLLIAKATVRYKLLTLRFITSNTLLIS